MATNMTAYESKRMDQAIIAAIKKGRPYVKYHSICWEKGIGWYGQTTRVNFADDENFIKGLRDAKEKQGSDSQDTGEPAY